MARFSRDIFVGRLWVPALVALVCGCSSLSGTNDRDGLKLAEPSPAFMKKVERDPFPRDSGEPNISYGATIHDLRKPMGAEGEAGSQKFAILGRT